MMCPFIHIHITNTHLHGLVPYTILISPHQPKEPGDQNPPPARGPTSDTKGIHTPEQASVSLLLMLYIPLVPKITHFPAYCLTAHRGLLLMAQ